MQANCYKLARRIAFVAILLVALVVSGTAYWYSRYLSTPGPEVTDLSSIVSIPKGSSVVTIKDILARANIINDDVRFLLLARFSGYASKLQAGEFLLPTNTMPLEILETLSKARPVEYSVTIPEGLTAVEIAEIFALDGWCEPTRFIELVHDPEFIKQVGFEGVNSLEGYLFPDTYAFTKQGGGAANILQLMVNKFKRVWAKLRNEFGEDIDQRKTVILASIVEKETGVASERGQIAGVFLNRLRVGMRLQSDPTVTYGIPDFTGKITKKHLRTPSPYNTYTLKGLPIGPICNPGRGALRAVLSPYETEFFYFVSKNDGTHQFSVTLSEHNRAVRKYQRKKSAKKGK